MENFIALVVIGVGGYIAWKVLLACLSGLSRAGDSITENWPRHFEKVWTSIITGVVSGFIIGFLAHGNPKIGTATGLGAAAAKFIWDIVQDKA